MNILFLTLFSIKAIDSYDIYSDLMRQFAKNDNKVYIVSPTEKRNKENTNIIKYDNFDDWHNNVEILRVKVGNIQKTNIIEKGFSTITLESKIKKAIKKYYKKIKFDLILYSTPPITLYKSIKYVKKRDNAKTYLMLKDIFPQNSVDLGMLKKSGIKGLIYKFFRKKETKLYDISDVIGCMSKKNIEYVVNNNKNLNNVVLCPNSIEIQDVTLSENQRNEMRKKYEIPLNKKIAVYGGNLGKPQDINFIIECLKVVEDIENLYILIVGDGTEYSKLEDYYNKNKNKNFKLMRRLPKNEYDLMISSCDIGLIFLDNRFTIPNFPSRLLNYMQAKLPIFAATDVNTDVGDVIISGKFGCWCESNNPQEFKMGIIKLLNSNLIELGNNGYRYLVENYNVEKQYNEIISEVNKI